MSYQNALCARIIRTGDIESAINYGITEDDFTNPEAKNLWRLLMSYYSQHITRGSVLSHDIMKLWFKNLELGNDELGLSFDALCYETRRERILVASNQAVVKFSQEVAIPTCNPAAQLAELHSTITQLLALGTTARTDVTLEAGLAGLLRRIDNARAGLDTSVMPWPWEALENETFGVQPTDYIVLYGRPKSMKTWVLCYLVSWAFQHQKRALVYTKEMTPENLFDRTLACICGIYYSELRASASRGSALRPEDEEKLFGLRQLILNDAQTKNYVTVLKAGDVPPGADTVSWLGSKVDKLRPDIVFVDGMYLMSDQEKAKDDHLRVRNISRGLRQLNLSTSIPIICTSQANRKAASNQDANLDEMAFSDGLAMDATIAARIINDKHSPTISFVIGGSREFKMSGFRIHAVPARDFSYHSELTEKDVEKAREADKSDDKSTKSSTKAKNKKHKDSTDEDVSAQLDLAVKQGALQ